MAKGPSTRAAKGSAIRNPAFDAGGYVASYGGKVTPTDLLSKSVVVARGKDAKGRTVAGLNFGNVPKRGYFVK